MFGLNIVTTEDDEWKRHRKVVAKAFTEPNNKLIWQETVDVVFDLFSMWKMEGRADEAIVENVSHLTKDLALMIISSAGKLSDDFNLINQSNDAYINCR
jgi:cytochrome P450